MVLLCSNNPPWQLSNLLPFTVVFSSNIELGLLANVRRVSHSSAPYFTLPAELFMSTMGRMGMFFFSSVRQHITHPSVEVSFRKIGWLHVKHWCQKNRSTGTLYMVLFKPFAQCCRVMLTELYLSTETRTGLPRFCFVFSWQCLHFSDCVHANIFG